MKISKEQIKKIIMEEFEKLTEISEISVSEEKRIARYVYILFKYSIYLDSTPRL